VDTQEFFRHEMILLQHTPIVRMDTANAMHHEQNCVVHTRDSIIHTAGLTLDTRDRVVHAKEFSTHEKCPREHAKDARHDKRTLVHDNDVFVQDDPAAAELRENPFLQHFSPNDMHPGVNDHKKTPRVHNQASRHRKGNPPQDDGASLQDDSAAPELHGARFVQDHFSPVMDEEKDAVISSLAMVNPPPILRTSSRCVLKRRAATHRRAGAVDKDDTGMPKAGARGPTRIIPCVIPQPCHAECSEGSRSCRSIRDLEVAVPTGKSNGT